jgi:hypothetical protein
MKSPLKFQEQIVEVIGFDLIVFIIALEGHLEIKILLNMHAMDSVSSGKTDTSIVEYLTWYNNNTR